MKPVCVTRVDAAPGSLFVAAAIAAGDALVITAGGCASEVGALAMVVLFVPGQVLGAIAVIPQEHAS